MDVPSEAGEFILFQRTEYIRFSNRLPVRALAKILPFPVYNNAVKLEARWFPGRIAREYQKDMEKEFDSIRDFLPRACSSLLDVGCGIAGIDVFLNRHYHTAPPRIYLLDKSKVDRRVWYNFKPSGAFYNSLHVAKKLLLDNGVNEKNVVLLEANEKNEINVDAEFDLVLSLISWGFHYPLETYLDRVYQLLSNGGHLIVDVRKLTEGVEVLRKRFADIRIVKDEEKYQRVLAIK